jgi:hypothetical protein
MCNVSKDKLVVEQDRYVWRVQWYLADEGDLGAVLGQEGEDVSVTSAPGTDDWDHETATVAARATTGCQKDSTGFYWESQNLASAALKAANAAIKNRPLAEWEKKAIEAGWKPPKGRL